MRQHRIIFTLLPLVLAVAILLVPAAPLAQAAEDAAPGQELTQDGEDLEQAEPTPSPEEPAQSEDTATPEPSPEPAPEEEPEPQPSPAEEEQPEEPEPSPDEEEEGKMPEEEMPPQTFKAAVGALKTGTHEAYLTGFTGKRFGPSNKMTRAEVCVMLYALLKEKPTELEYKFADVKASDWYGPGVAAIHSLGAVSGLPDGSFGPKKTISRAEFVVILASFFEPPEEEPTADFTDVPENHWAYKAVAVSQARGWTAGFADGTFRPGATISRAEVVTIMNVALGRRGEGFAADRDVQEFVDVPKTHWAFLDIAEAADPVNEPDPTPVPDPTPGPEDNVGGFKVGGTVKVNAETGLNIRKGPGTSNPVVTAVTNGTLLTVTDVSKYPWLGVKTSGGLSGYSLSDYLLPYTGGDGPSQNGDLSASSMTLHQYMSARLDATADSNISSMRWSSSNESVAKVGYTIDYSAKSQSAIVYAGSPGTAVLSYADGTGKVKATCTVTVTQPQPVRFAYADGNTVPLKQNFDLVAVTDNTRDEVRFDIVSGPAGGSFSSSAYEEESVKSSYDLPANTVRVFRRTVQFGAAGLYTLKAYSSSNGVYSNEACTFTVLVTQAGDTTTATNETRRVSGRMLDMLAVFEGYVQEIEDDRVVAGNPTVGHGYVVAKNSAFYNNLTKTEAYAMLTETVNNGSYSKAVENFRKENDIKMSQAQYDALVSFVYNCGPGALSLSRYDTPNIILNMVAPPTDASSSKPYTGTLNVVAAKMYSAASSTSSTVVQVPKGAAVQVVGVQVNRSTTKQEVWYKVNYSGSSGWLPSGYVKLSGNFTRDLTYADSTSLANEFIQWHRAGGICVPGLLYRRLAECKIFFFGNYTDAVNGAANYRKNTYGFLYPSCCKHLDQR